MKMNDAVKTLLLSTTVAFASSAFATPALAVSEKEINDYTSIAQVLTSDGTSIQVSAVMGFAEYPQRSDVDFFQFSANAGDILTIDISNAYQSHAPLDTTMAVFGPAPAYEMLRSNDDETNAQGEFVSYDPRIEDFVAPVTGVYTIGVTTSPRAFYNGAMVSRPPFGVTNVISSYELTAGSGPTSTTKKINIEVKPGNDGLAPLNPRSKGKIPVAILGSANFTAINVDTSTLTFGSTGDEQSLSKCAKSGEDVNDDGFYDLVCHFENQQAAFRIGDLEGVLKGKTKNGEMFEGRAFLKVLPSKRN